MKRRDFLKSTAVAASLSGLASALPTFAAEPCAAPAREFYELQRLNQTNETLAPRIAQLQARLRDQTRRRQILKAKFRREQAAAGAGVPEDSSHEDDETAEESA